MADMIDRESLLNKLIFGNSDSIVLRGYAIEFVKAAPVVDAVPVVRCRECKHYRRGICWMHSTGTNYKDLSAAVPMEPDDFCSYGERMKKNG